MMKTFTNSLAGLILLALTFNTAEAQTKGNGNVISQERQLTSFDGIDVGSAINLFVSQGGKQSVKVETDENLQEKVITRVESGTLTLSSRNIKNSTKLNVYVTIPVLNRLEASGASEVKGLTPFKSDNFELSCTGASEVSLEITSHSLKNNISGASEVKLKVSAQEINTEASGASEIELSGTAKLQKIDLSGAMEQNSADLVTEITSGKLSGASDCTINATKQINIHLSGASSIEYSDHGKKKKITENGQYDFPLDK